MKSNSEPDDQNRSGILQESHPLNAMICLAGTLTYCPLEKRRILEAAVWTGYRGAARSRFGVVCDLCADDQFHQLKKSRLSKHLLSLVVGHLSFDMSYFPSRRQGGRNIMGIDWFDIRWQLHLLGILGRHHIH